MIADWWCRTEVKPLILKGILVTLWVITVLGGCAAVPNNGVFARQPLEFSMVGKLAFKDNNEGYAARFKWQQYKNSYVIQVWGPLGQGLTSFEGDGKTIQVSRGGAILANGSPKNIMLANLNWFIPPQVLAAWLRGQPGVDDAYVNAVTNAYGGFDEFEQLGWRVELSNPTLRKTRPDALMTPGRIVARNAGKKVVVVVREFLN